MSTDPSVEDAERARWDASHRSSSAPTLSRIKRASLSAVLPEGVEPTTLWPAWPLDVVADALDLTAGQTLVDVACGRGEVGLWIARYLDVRWVGVDPSPVGLEIAADRARPADRMVNGHFLATGLADDTADAVLLVDALHFAKDVPATVAELARVLRPGGRLVIVGPQQTDPRPALTACGFAIERDEQTPDFVSVMTRFLGLVRAEADALLPEIGEQMMARLTAATSGELSAMKHGLIAARAPRASG